MARDHLASAWFPPRRQGRLLARTSSPAELTERPRTVKFDVTMTRAAPETPSTNRSNFPPPRTELALTISCVPRTHMPMGSAPSTLLPHTFPRLTIRYTVPYLFAAATGRHWFPSKSSDSIPVTETKRGLSWDPPEK